MRALPHSATAIRVISLPQSHTRRASISSQTAQTALEWSFFDAFESLNGPLDYNEREAFLAKGRGLSPRELGAYSSHYALWSWFVESPYHQLLVLEDDVLLDWDFLATLTGYDLAAHKIDFLRLYAMAPGLCRSEGVLAGRPLIQYLTYVYGAQAYFLSRQGAQRLLNHACIVRRPIDDVLDRTWDHGIPNLSIFPFPVIELALPSTIGPLDPGANITATPQLRALRALRRLKERGRRAAFLAGHLKAFCFALRPDPGCRRETSFQPPKP